MRIIRNFAIDFKEVVFADDFTVAGKLTSIRDYWGKLTVLGPKYGYFPKALKSYLIVKEEKLVKQETYLITQT